MKLSKVPFQREYKEHIVYVYVNIEYIYIHYICIRISVNTHTYINTCVHYITLPNLWLVAVQHGSNS